MLTFYFCNRANCVSHRMDEYTFFFFFFWEGSMCIWDAEYGMRADVM